VTLASNARLAARITQLPGLSPSPPLAPPCSFSIQTHMMGQGTGTGTARAHITPEQQQVRALLGPSCCAVSHLIPSLALPAHLLSLPRLFLPCLLGGTGHQGCLPHDSGPNSGQSERAALRASALPQPLSPLSTSLSLACLRSLLYTLCISLSLCLPHSLPPCSISLAPSPAPSTASRPRSRRAWRPSSPLSWADPMR
jgi:hypothetical protein